MKAEEVERKDRQEGEEEGLEERRIRKQRRRESETGREVEDKERQQIKRRRRSRYEE